MQTNYGIFFSGNASTPSTIGIIDWSIGEKVHEVQIKGETGKAIRADYEKKKALLMKVYKSILSA